MKPEKQTQTFLASTKEMAAKVSNLRVARFFRDSDMRCSHDGLMAMAAELGCHYEDLKPGEFWVFVNRMENRLKILTVGGVLVYIKSPGDRKFDLDIVRYLPKFFRGGSIDYKNALTEMIMAKGKK